MECKTCANAADKTAVLYEDNVSLVMLPKESAVLGDIYVFPKQHAPFFEDVPDIVAQHCMFLANHAASAIFESLGAHGTNIIVRNGPQAGGRPPHLAIEVISRKQDDGINLQWTPQSLTPEEMDDVAKKIRDKSDVLAAEKVHGKPEKIEVKEQKGEKKEGSGSIEGEDNYWVRDLRRIP